MTRTTDTPDTTAVGSTSPLRRFLEKFKPPAPGELRPEAAEHVEKLREIRRNAKKAARSGNPAKRIPAQRVVDQVGPAIAAVYRVEARRGHYTPREVTP